MNAEDTNPYHLPTYLHMCKYVESMNLYANPTFSMIKKTKAQLVTFAMIDKFWVELINQLFFVKINNFSKKLIKISNTVTDTHQSIKFILKNVILACNKFDTKQIW